MNQVITSIQKIQTDGDKTFLTSKNLSVLKTGKDSLTICKSRGVLNMNGKMAVNDVDCNEVKVKDMTFEDIIKSITDMNDKITKSSHKSRKARTKKVSKSKKSRK